MFTSQAQLTYGRFLRRNCERLTVKLSRNLFIFSLVCCFLPLGVELMDCFQQNISDNWQIEYSVKALKPTAVPTRMISTYGCTQQRQSIYKAYSGKIFNTDRCTKVVTYVHWCWPGLRSRVTITLLWQNCTEVSAASTFDYSGSQNTYHLEFASSTARIFSNTWKWYWSI